MVGFGFLQIGNTIIAFSVFYPKIYNFEPKLLIAFSPLALGVIIFSIIIWLTAPNSKKAMDVQGELQNFIMEAYKGKSSIKNYHGEKSFIKRFYELSRKEMVFFFRAGIGPALSVPLVKLSFGLSLLWGAKIIFDNNLGASSLVFFSGFLFLILEPLAFLSWIGIVISSGIQAWKRIVRVLDDLASQTKIEIKTNQFKQKSEVEEKVLGIKIELWQRPVHIDLMRCEWNVFIGETGVGKSYVLNSIADLLKALNKSITMVFQEPYLYNDTLGANIFLGKKPTDKDIALAKRLIRIFSLDILETETSNILDIELGENGKKISGGQAKRISLIRSLFCDCDYYIWDDPFSSVDMIHEEEIIDRIQSMEEFKNKTFIITSHRLSTVKHSNYLIYLDRELGIKEKGIVDELLNKKSQTAEYFEKQLV
jgi:ATP-binding cassette subfamily B protein